MTATFRIVIALVIAFIAAGFLAAYSKTGGIGFAFDTVTFVIVAAANLLSVFLSPQMFNAAETIRHGKREQGVVKWFNFSKGYGFITRDSGDDVFVHHRAIRGPGGRRRLNDGQRVDFLVTESEKGLQADDVTVLEEKDKKKS